MLTKCIISSILFITQLCAAPTDEIDKNPHKGNVWTARYELNDGSIITRDSTGILLDRTRSDDKQGKGISMDDFLDLDINSTQQEFLKVLTNSGAYKSTLINDSEKFEN